MTYLGLDLGTKTLGISKSNGVIASFYKTIRHNADYDYLIGELEQIVKDESVDKIILGYPKNMNNTESDMSKIVLEFKKKIEDKIQIEVILEDERLTSKISNDLLISGNVSRMKRKKVVDGIASVVILESFLDRRNNGK